MMTRTANERTAKPLCADADEPPKETYDRRFDPYRIPRTERARKLVRQNVQHIETLEEMLELRARKRKAADRPTFEATVGAIVCDVVHRHLTAPGKWLAIQLSNRVLGCSGRYRSRVMGQTLPDVVERLSMPQLGCIEVRKGTRRAFGPAKATTIRIGRHLKRWIEEEGFELSDFGRSGTEELIILKRPKEGHWDLGARINYEETPDTERYRAEMRRINLWLAKGDISFDEAYEEEEVVDPSDRTLRRVFNRDFQRGGRLFGGFWLPLSKEQRFNGIAINGEGIAELDFGQMAARLAYARAGAIPPPGDLYAVPGVNLSREGARDGVKAVLNAMLYSSQPLTRFPPNSRKGLRGSFEGVAKAVRKHHASIEHLFFKGIGMETMFMESEILVEVLLGCEKLGIVALPIHDAILVQQSASKEARGLMLEAFFKHTGLEGQVDVVPS